MNSVFFEHGFYKALNDYYSVNDPIEMPGDMSSTRKNLMTDDSNPYRRRIRSTNTDRSECISTALMIPKISRMLPPDFRLNHKKTLLALKAYKKFDVHYNSEEYKTFAALMYPSKIKSVELIINSTLWEKFISKRREMLKMKSDDVTLLNKLGCTKNELKRSLQQSHDFHKHPKVADIPYNDNMALLFHYVRDTENIDTFLDTGTYDPIGKGICFYDNLKSIMNDTSNGIIVICGVLLGDCLYVDPETAENTFREPEKHEDQKRNVNDLSFDSIVSAEGVGNAYVIFNRSHCCPLYIVKYGGSNSGEWENADSLKYMNARRHHPPFCWISTEYELAMPSLKRLVSQNWPFYADNLFAKMGSTV